jgi:hypothetical protein
MRDASLEVEAQELLEREARAEKRRGSWMGGVVSSFVALQDLDDAQWRAIRGAERVKCIWPLTMDALVFAGHNGPAPRLQRSLGGIRSR